MSGEPQPVARDELPNPLEDKRRALREEAVSQVLNGEATPRSAARAPSSSWAASSAAGPGTRAGRPRSTSSWPRQTTDRVFVILAEFGNERHPSYPDQDTDPRHARARRSFDGPLRNEIPEPDRSVDNSTVWQPDYNRAHFEETYFGDGRTWSRSRPTTRSSRPDATACPARSPTGSRCATTRLATAGPTASRAPATSAATPGTSSATPPTSGTPTRSPPAARRAEVNAELATFDKWDRYDFDGDGNFNESDGYIDHFQIVHAGGDQADGDPWQGEDAIWSHRWYAFQNNTAQGPPGNPRGGTQIGTSGIWIGDYTIQPENGGRSVFFHEFGHDLGLPDDYNILHGGDNNNEHWTLMAQSRLGAKGEQFIGDRAGDLGAWNKLQLGWLDYETLVAVTASAATGRSSSARRSTTPRIAQAAVVVLPEEGGRHRPRRTGRRQRSSGTAARATTSRTR